MFEYQNSDVLVSLEPSLIDVKQCNHLLFSFNTEKKQID